MSPAEQIFKAFDDASRSAKIIHEYNSSEEAAQIIKQHEEKHGAPATIIFWDGKGRHPLDQSEAVDTYAIRNSDGSYDNDLGA